MMRFFNSTVLTAILGTGTLVGLITWGLLWQVEEINPEPPPAEEKPPVVSREVDLIGRQLGQDRWRLISQAVEMVEGEQIFDQGAHGFFYGPPKEITSSDEPFFSNLEQMEWEADTARYDAANDLLFLNDDVQVRDPDGSELLTDALKVTPEELIEVPAPFTLTGDDVVLSGESGSFNFQFALMIASQGKLVALPPEAEDPAPPSPQSQGLTLGSALAASNLEVPEDDPDAEAADDPLETAAAKPDATTITADQLTYNRLSQIAEGQGSLTIEEEGLEIHADWGTYDRREGASRLVGAVQLREISDGSESLLPDLQIAQNNTNHADPGPISPEDEELTITADQLNYDRDTQIAQGEGNLEIQQGDTLILAPEGTYRRRESESILQGGVTLDEPGRLLASQTMNGNHRDKIFLFEQEVLYTQYPEADEDNPEPIANPDQPELQIQADELVYNSPDQTSKFSSNVIFTRFEQPDTEGAGSDPQAELRRAETEVKSSELTYDATTEISEFIDNVEFTQRGRKATAARVVINPEQVILTGDVYIEQIDGNWLAQRFEDPDSQDMVSRPTLIFADRVEIDQATSDAYFYDNVVIVQANRAAEGDTATYVDSSQEFILNSDLKPVLLCDRGDVGDTDLQTVEGLPGRNALDETCRGANQIQSQRIVLDMLNDEFSAEGQSSMKFRVAPDQPF